MECVKVNLRDAETARLKLLKLSALDKNYSIKRDENYVYFPITKSIKGFSTIKKNLYKKNRTLSFKELLKTKLNKKEINILTNSYDVIGNIAILEINKELLYKKKLIAGALLHTNINIRTIVRKLGGHEGKYRIQKYEYLAGERNFEATHRENGIILKLNIKKVYFSPRLNNERLRIARLVKKGELVLVMFSGISPYEINISKHSKAKEIYGIEINKSACKYAIENVKINNLNNIKLYYGDVRKVLPKLKIKFDRIIMPLPKDAGNFLDLAVKHLKKKGILHFYCFSMEEKINEVIKSIKKKYNFKTLNIVKCGQQSPRVYRYCIDFKFSG